MVQTDRKRTTIIIIGMGLAVIVVILAINILIFRNYEANLISLQQDSMLTIAKTTASSLGRYYEDTITNFSIATSFISNTEQLEDYFNKLDYPIAAVYLLSREGSVLQHWGQEYDFSILNQIPLQELSGKVELFQPLLINEGQFVQIMATEKAVGEETLVFAVVIEVEGVYGKIVKPIKVGENGYSMVKDINGTILMHSASNQIGLDAVEGRQEYYSERELDLEDLNFWVEEQKNNPEGSRILRSYWWGDPDVPESKKIVAFTQIEIGQDKWIVNCTLDYTELAGPINRTLYLVGISSAVLIIFFALLLYQTINHMNIANNMCLEVNHLTELNNALEDLKRSNEIIRHTNKLNAIGTMTGMISHEFNNYLTPIRLYCDLMLTNELVDKQTREYAGEILEAAKGAEELTRELSYYSRRDKISYKFIFLDIEQQIRRSLKIVRKTLPVNVDLDVRLKNQALYIRAAYGMVNQIIVNLCTNAVHAMSDKGGLLTVEGEIAQQHGQALYQITISDTGEGIASDAIKHIFQPFYTTKPAGKGTGLGLSVVKDLVRQMGGTIEAFSGMGEGSRFVVMLPLVEPVDIENQASCEARMQFQPLRILVLDDKKNVGKAIQKTLQERYDDTIYFSHPTQALSAVKEQPARWDVILTNYIMPTLNGLELSSILRNLGVKATIILMSGSLDFDVEWYMENGIIDGVLEKPVTLKSFEKEVYRIIS